MRGRLGGGGALGAFSRRNFPLEIFYSTRFEIRTEYGAQEIWKMLYIGRLYVLPLFPQENLKFTNCKFKLETDRKQCLLQDKQVVTVNTQQHL